MSQKVSYGQYFNVDGYMSMRSKRSVKRLVGREILIANEKSASKMKTSIGEWALQIFIGRI